jgi:hypothetical protein
VVIDGQRVAGGRLMFAPASQDNTEPGKPAFANIQPDGSFVLTTYSDGDGAVVGEHWVTIFPPSDDSVATNLPKFRRYTVRRKQSVVAGQDNVIDIQLQSQDIARFASQ